MTGLAKNYGNWWSAARQISRWQLPTASGIERAWAYGTLAELELLGIIFGGKEFNADAVKEKIVRCCREIKEICTTDLFPVKSTKRQFRRYVEIWDREEWRELAQAGIDTLNLGLYSSGS